MYILEMEATTIYADETHVIVICPYCQTTHKHGNAPGANYRSSHCNQGEYKLGPLIEPYYIFKAIERRQFELGRMKEKRILAKANKSINPSQ